MIDEKELTSMYCQMGDLIQLQNLISQHKRILQQHGTLALHQAVKFKQLHVVQFLVTQPDIDINCLNNQGQTVLFKALPDLQMMGFLIDTGCNIDYQDKEGWTVLMHAARLNLADCVQYLIDRNCNINLKGGHGQKTAFERAESSKIKYIINQAAICQRTFNCVQLQTGPVQLHQGLDLVKSLLYEEIRNTLDTSIIFASQLQKESVNFKLAKELEICETNLVEKCVHAMVFLNTKLQQEITNYINLKIKIMLIKEGIEPPCTPINVFKQLEISLLKQPNVEQILGSFRHQINYFQTPAKQQIEQKTQQQLTNKDVTSLRYDLQSYVKQEIAQIESKLSSQQQEMIQSHIGQALSGVETRLMTQIKIGIDQLGRDMKTQADQVIRESVMALTTQRRLSRIGDPLKESQHFVDECKSRKN